MIFKPRSFAFHTEASLPDTWHTCHDRPMMQRRNKSGTQGMMNIQDPPIKCSKCTQKPCTRCSLHKSCHSQVDAWQLPSLCTSSSPPSSQVHRTKQRTVIKQDCDHQHLSKTAQEISKTGPPLDSLDTWVWDFLLMKPWLAFPSEEPCSLEESRKAATPKKERSDVAIFNPLKDPVKLGACSIGETRTHEPA